MQLKIEKTSLRDNSKQLKEFSLELIQAISSFNTYLSVDRVLSILAAGKTIHTSFSKYKLIDKKEETHE